MRKEDFLQSQVEQILIEVDFINKYKAMGDRFGVRDESFKINTSEVLTIANELGFSLKYSKSKEFYLTENIEGHQFSTGFTIRFNSFDFGLSIKNEAKGISSAAPWDFLVKLMTEDTVKVNRVCFRNYTDIKFILKDFFSLYEEIKIKMIC